MHAGQGAGQLGDELLRLARGGAVADGDERHAVAGDEPVQALQRRLTFVLRGVGVDGVRGQQFARRVNHGHFAAGAEAGIDGQHRVAGEGRLAEQAAQVVGEDGDGVRFGLFGERAAHVTLDGGQEQALGSIGHSQFELLAQGGTGVGAEGGAHGQQPVALADVDFDAQDFLCLAAIDGQDLVRAQAVDAPRVIIVELVAPFFVGGVFDAADLDGAIAAPFRV